MPETYRIHGYDQLFGDKYVSDQTYSSRTEAQENCSRMEWVEKGPPPKLSGY